MAAFYQPSGHHAFRVFDQNKENALPTRTPGLNRSMVGKDSTKAAAPRTVAPKTTNGKLAYVVAGPSTVYRDRNVLATGRKPGADVGNGKGKALAGGSGGDSKDGTPGADVEPKRLFTQHIAPTTSTSLSSFSHTVPPSSKKAAPPTIRRAPVAVRDFTTPYVSRTAQARTPAPAANGANILATPLPSATRARRRSRQSSTPNLSDSLVGSTSLLRATGPGTAQSYVTPQRFHKDDDSFEMGDESFGLDDERAGNISNGSLKVGNVSLENLEEEEEESDGEIEYMPPKATPLPDEPLFPKVDFKTIGRNILANPCLGMWEEEPGEVPVLHTSFTDEELAEGGYVLDGDDSSYRINLRSIEEFEDTVFAALEAQFKAKKTNAKSSTYSAKRVAFTATSNTEAKSKPPASSVTRRPMSNPPLRSASQAKLGIAQPTRTAVASTKASIGSRTTAGVVPPLFDTAVRSATGPSATTRPVARPAPASLRTGLSQTRATVSRQVSGVKTTLAAPAKPSKPAMLQPLSAEELDRMEEEVRAMLMLVVDDEPLDFGLDDDGVEKSKDEVATS